MTPNCPNCREWADERGQQKVTPFTVNGGATVHCAPDYWLASRADRLERAGHGSSDAFRLALLGWDEMCVVLSARRTA